MVVWHKDLKMTGIFLGFLYSIVTYTNSTSTDHNIVALRVARRVALGPIHRGGGITHLLEIESRPQASSIELKLLSNLSFAVGYCLNTLEYGWCLSFYTCLVTNSTTTLVY